MIELLIINPGGEKELLQFDQQEISIGRDPACDLVLNSPRISWRHARLFMTEEEDVWVEDLGSTNGTKLNDARITGARLVTLDDHLTLHNFQISLWQLLDATASSLIPLDGRSREIPVTADPDEEVMEGPTIAILPDQPGGGAVKLGGGRPHRQTLVYDPSGSGAERKSTGWSPFPAAKGGREGSREPKAPTSFPPDDLSESQLIEEVLEEVLEESVLELEEETSETALPPQDAAQSVETPASPRKALEAKSAPRKPFLPRAPNDLKELGLKRGIVVDLILKTVFFAGELSGFELSHQLKLPFGTIIEPIIQDLRRDQLLDVKGGGHSFGAISMIYSVTERAGKLIHQILDRNRYVGPAPISMDAYINLVESQSGRGTKITRKVLNQSFSDMVLEDEIYDGIGPAMNSGMAMLIYGPPGNGKSMICQRMVECFEDILLIPYAVEVDGNIIKVFDEHTHRPVGQPDPAASAIGFDNRFVPCRRPLIMVGGELSLDMLDMRYSPEARFYEAPIQMKANGGLLMIDDLGRQKASPKELLNRWIVPLESRVDFVSLVTGKKLRVPFDVSVVFATNLDPDDLVDDAFLRRVRYKLEVRRPTQERYQEIFQRACTERRVPWDAEAFEYLMEKYRKDGRPINACEPRNMLEALISLAEYLECPARLEPELIDRIYRSYFTRKAGGSPPAGEGPGRGGAAPNGA